MSSHDIVLFEESNWWYRESIVTHIPYNPTLLGLDYPINIDITHTIDWGCE